MKRDIDIGRQFSKFPAGRWECDGPKSGELFRNQVLAPLMAEQQLTEVTIYLDNAMGYGSSFLEEAFGGLVRAGVPVMQIRSKIRFISDDPALLGEIDEYIEEAANKIGKLK